MHNNRIIETFIFNYNGKNTVLSTISTLKNSEDVQPLISVIDDHSTDESPELIKSQFPEILVQILPKNTKKLNILKNKALDSAKSEYVFLTDNDLSFDKKCLSELLKVMESDSRIATCTPRLMYWDQPDKVYSADTKVHFIGAAISDQRDKPYTGNNKPSMNSGGGICLVRLSAARHVGGFNEDLLIGWGDDGEFYQRLLRAGYKCLYVPSAFALHENKLNSTSASRKYRVIGQTYNRWFFILTHYSVSLILLLIPLFIVYEAIETAFVLIKGVLPQHFKGNILVLKNLPHILEKRKAIQKLKVVSDKEILFSGKLYIAPALIEKNKILKIMASFLSGVLNLYWEIIVKIIP